jgi:PhnB protein
VIVPPFVATASRARSMSSTLEPHDAFWGDRYAQVKDPFGHLWSIGAPIKGEK